ncbi:MAG TPA: tetratricopeptide repeat protein [Saprospiraceae bacterium]|nr:tetratricopeptide repeat protein [Saprospiraceae bacterium]HMQ82984.1 tetratricopeptide repeat protein [Saprospiraceae bacterium]
MSSDVNSFEFQAKLQQYLSGDLPEAERKELEENFQESETAREEWLFSWRLALVNKHKELATVHQIAAQSIEKIGWQMPVSSVRSRWKIWWTTLLGLGIGAVLVVFSMRYFAHQGQIKSYQQLVEQYFEPLEPLLITDTQINQTLDRAMQLYRAGNYNQAASSFESYLEEENDENAVLYLGISYLAQGKDLAAITALESVNDPSIGPVYSTAQWYLSMAYLNRGAHEEAIVLLERLQSDALYADKASDMLQKLLQLK